jgi:hypothetical protein
VLGFVPGVRGGFEVPVAAIPHLVRCASVGVDVPVDHMARRMNSIR